MATRGLLFISVAAAALTGAPSLATAAEAAADTTSGDQVVVTARAKIGVLAEKKAAPASTAIISAQEIEDRPVSNVVDAVSILPGVSAFADNGRGQAATGQPEYVTINGIASNYNAYQLNGVRVPAADPSTRALSLKLLPPFGLQSIEVVKTPGANYDGDSIGGVLNIKTPSAFDYAGSLTKITVQGQLNELASDSGFNGAGGAIQAEFARRYLDGKIGIYGTIFYKKESSISEAGEIGGYSPTHPNTANLPLGQVAISPTSYKWDLQHNNIATTGGAFGLDYHGANTRLYVRGTAVSYDDKSEDSQVNIRSGGGGYYVQDQTGAYVPSTAANATLTMTNAFQGHYFQLRDQVDSLYTVQAGGDSDLGRLHLAYETSYGYAELTQPNYVEGSLYGMPSAGGTYQIGMGSNGYTPQVTFGALSGSSLNAASTAAYVLDQRNNAVWKYQGADSGSRAKQFGAKIDADYKADFGVVKVIHAGLNLNFSDRLVWDHYFVHGNNNDYVLTPGGMAANYNNPQGPTVNNLPGQNVASFLGYPGVSGLDQFRSFARGSFIDGITRHKYQDVNCIPDIADDRTCPGAYTINDYNAGAASNTENIYAGYVSADLNFDKLTLYPGVRIEQTEFSGKAWAPLTNTTGGYINLGHDYTEVLPNIAAVYRTDNAIVVRASVRKGFSRPAFSQLIPNPSVSIDDVAKTVYISQGNPDLKPTESVNYDVSVEYYGVKDSVFEVAGYYKTLTNFTYTQSVTGGGPAYSNNTTLSNISVPAGYTIPTGYQVIATEPQNGVQGSIQGVTLNAQQRLAFLPGLASGLGYRANLTLQHSSTKLGGPLPQSPDMLYNIEVTYDLHKIHADLAYQYTGLQLVNGGNGNDGNIPQYLQPTEFLNFSLGYQVGKVNLSFQAKNLTDAPTFWKTVGKSKQYLGVQDGGGNGSYIHFGRTFNLIATYSF
ncbi:MAG: TonB-dependent receptor [Caulobacteraceae bacterium]|nr:TonB-dependent receptor [Caulobacteraceae bacterium]